MIQIRMMKSEDLKAVNQLLKECNMDFDYLEKPVSQCFVVEDGANICGLSAYKPMDDVSAEIDFIYIRDEDRGFKFGDGLFRGLMNHLDHQKIRDVYIYSTLKTNGFFISEGLEIIPTDKTSEEVLTFKATLPDFFMSPCKSSRGKS